MWSCRAGLYEQSPVAASYQIQGSKNGIPTKQSCAISNTSCAFGTTHSRNSTAATMIRSQPCRHKDWEQKECSRCFRHAPCRAMEELMVHQWICLKEVQPMESPCRSSIGQSYSPWGEACSGAGGLGELPPIRTCVD